MGSQTAYNRPAAGLPCLGWNKKGPSLHNRTHELNLEPSNYAAAPPWYRLHLVLARATAPESRA
jgi:hypothetical protein